MFTWNSFNECVNRLLTEFLFCDCNFSFFDTVGGLMHHLVTVVEIILLIKEWALPFLLKVNMEQIELSFTGTKFCFSHSPFHFVFPTCNFFLFLDGYFGIPVLFGSSF